MLQVNSTIGTQVKTIIESTALTDSFTGATPNSQWGHGKLDVAAAVLFLMEDTTPPTIDVPTRIPFTPTSTQTVDVNVTVTDNVAVDTVILSYNAGVLWVNVSTLALNATLYNGMIPTFSNGTVVMYRFYANDTSDNWAVSGIYSYTVSDMSTTTTTTTGTGTTTTSTGPTNTTTPTTPQSPDYLRIAILLSVVFAFIILVVIYNRRRSS
ncbi:MAG: hypothetical protein ACW99G_21265 [Candidatus Thorarchaeota archaeon]|jgi:hypothetical protein